MKIPSFFAALLIYASAVCCGFVGMQPSASDDESELARLMRTMYDDAETIRKAVLEKRPPEDFREKFRAIHTAQPTDPDVRNENFAAFGNGFLIALDRLYQNEGDQVQNFNTMVLSCIACHQRYCPGPIGKIKKLYIGN